METAEPGQRVLVSHAWSLIFEEPVLAERRRAASDPALVRKVLGGISKPEKGV